MIPRDPEKWKNRITEDVMVDPVELSANPLNWRKHPQFQKDALKDVLEKIGWVQKVVINKRTGHLVDGHLRLALAMENLEHSIPAVCIDVDECEEKILIATLDPLGALAGTDAEKLQFLIQSVGSDNGKISEMLAELAIHEGIGKLKVDFKEYDDSVESEVQYLECPSCGHKFPK